MILITGASGMFGGRTADLLVAAGQSVRALTHSADKVAALRARGMDAAIGDMENPASLAAAMRGIERVFLVSPMQAGLTTREINVIDAARAGGVAHVVKLHGAVEHHDELIRWHEAVIDHLKASGLAWTLVSPNSVMESNFLPQAESIRHMNMIFGCAGRGRVGFVAAADAARVAAHVLSTDGHAGMNYEITGSESLSFFDAAAHFTHVLGRTITYQDMPEQEFADMLINAAGRDPKTIEIEVLCHYRAFRQGGGDRVTDTYQRLIGHAPTSFDDFIRACLDRW
jgi:NAD(P)H dehydrogenase (quinone)